MNEKRITVDEPLRRWTIEEHADGSVIVMREERGMALATGRQRIDEHVLETTGRIDALLLHQTT